MREGQIVDLTQQYKSIAVGINPVEVVTALNVGKEKEKFLAQAEEGEFGNPKFEYDEKLLSEVAKNKQELQEIGRELISEDAGKSKPADKVFLKLLANRVDDAIMTTKLAEAILAGSDTEALGASRGKYGDLKLDMVQSAKTFVSHLAEGRGRCELPEEKRKPATLESEQVEILKSAKMNSQKIAAMFWKVLQEYQLEKEFRIEISETAQSIDVRDKTLLSYPTIVVPKDREVSVYELARLVGHEIESHVLQSVNGQKFLRGIGGGLLKTDNETLYEGLAVHNDLCFDLTVTKRADKMPKPWYTLATEMALEGQGFSEVAQRIYELRLTVGETPEKARKGAWTTTYRVFRGCSNPAKNPAGYAFLKDKGYFEGFHIVKPAMKTDARDWLHTGIFTPDELEMLRLTKAVKPQALIKSKAMSLKIISDFLENA